MIYTIKTGEKEMHVEIQENKMLIRHRFLSKRKLTLLLKAEMEECLDDFIPDPGFDKLAKHGLCITFMHVNEIRVFIIGDTGFKSSYSPDERILSVLNSRFSHYWQNIFSMDELNSAPYARFPAPLLPPHPRPDRPF